MAMLAGLVELLGSAEVLQGVKYGLASLTLWMLLLQALRFHGGPASALPDKTALNAYYTAGLVPICGLVWVGFGALPRLWAPTTPEERLLREVPAARIIGEMQIGYQMFCIVGGLLCGPPLTKAEYMLHHVAAGVASLLSLRPFAQHYSLYFGSAIEVTNVLLTVLDIFKLNRHLIRERPKVYLVCKFFFALSFLSLRNIIFPAVALQMMRDVYILRERIPLAGQVISHTVLVSLTALQMIWGSLVAQSVLATLRSFGKTGKEQEAGKAGNKEEAATPQVVGNVPTRS